MSPEHKWILDFGCGNGAQTILLPETSHVLAADIDRADLLRLQGVLRENKIRHILPLQFDGDRLPVRSQSIDMAISFEVLEHVADESTALQELYRVLKPGGQLILSVPNKWWIFETHGAYLPLLPWNRVPFF
ncbi:MAG: class I SAM-dependent methyltransferase, partial [Calditrichaeota bacterium]